MSAVSRIVRISDINVNIPPAEVDDEVRKIFSRDFTDFDIAVVKPKTKKTRLVFLTFQSIRDADRAVKIHSRLRLFGDPVRVAFDVSNRKVSDSQSVNDLLQRAKSLISHYNDEGISTRPSVKSTFSNVSSTKLPPSQTLFIGKLNKFVRKRDIENGLKRYGIIDSVMIYNHNPNRIFAFVKFFNLFMARKALKSMIGRKFLQLDCLFGYGQTAASNILWIGGIGPWIDIILLKKKFEEFGEVKNVEWPPDKNFAYVEFDNIRSARRALEKLRGTVLGKKRISIDYSDRSQMTSNINYGDIYLGGDSDSEDEIVTNKPSRYSVSHFDYDVYRKEMDVYFDEIYRSHPEHFEDRSLERSPVRNERRYDSEKVLERRADLSPRHSSPRREAFEWKNGKYEDDFYAPMDRDFPDRRSQDFEVGLKCTIKNDLYHGQRSPGKTRERTMIDDYPETRKRKDYDDRSLSSLPYKKHRSRSRERPSHDAMFEKFPKDRYYSRRSPSNYSDRGHDKGYKESFDFRRSPDHKSPMNEPYVRSKYENISSHLSPESSLGYAHSKQTGFESTSNFSVRQTVPETRVSREKWYSDEQYPSERSGFELPTHGAGHSPATRFSYKGPTPHAVQMSSGYETELLNRNLFTMDAELIRKYPSVWTGGITFKNKCYWTSMSLISGSIPLVNALLNDSLPLDMKLLKITQRLRLDMPEKLIELDRRVDIAGRNGSSILLAFPAVKMDSVLSEYDRQPLGKLSNFLKETQLAAVVLLPTERSFSTEKGVLHIFPRCQFSIDFLQREAPELSSHFEAGDNLLMIVMKDMSQ